MRLDFAWWGQILALFCLGFVTICVASVARGVLEPSQMRWPDAVILSDAVVLGAQFSLL